MPKSCRPLTILLIQNRNATLFRIMDIVIYREKTENTQTKQKTHKTIRIYFWVVSVIHFCLYTKSTFSCFQEEEFFSTLHHNKNSTIKAGCPLLDWNILFKTYVYVFDTRFCKYTITSLISRQSRNLFHSQKTR